MMVRPRRAAKGGAGRGAQVWSWSPSKTPSGDFHRSQPVGTAARADGAGPRAPIHKVEPAYDLGDWACG